MEPNLSPIVVPSVPQWAGCKHMRAMPAFSEYRKDVATMLVSKYTTEGIDAYNTQLCKYIAEGLPLDEKSSALGVRVG